MDGDGNVYLALGNGDGTFQYPGTEILSGQHAGYQAGTDGREAIIDDFNADSKLDIAACAGFGTRTPVVLGNGDGTFQPPTIYPVGPPSFFEVQAGDFNSDGRADLIVTQFGGYNGFSIFLGNGDGTFQAQQNISSTGPTTEKPGIPAGDFNTDGLLDLILIGAGYQDVVLDQK